VAILRPPRSVMSRAGAPSQHRRLATSGTRDDTQRETERRSYGRLVCLDTAGRCRLVVLQIRQKGRLAERLQCWPIPFPPAQVGNGPYTAARVGAALGGGPNFTLLFSYQGLRKRRQSGRSSMQPFAW
jgi:hypothetical protein